MVSRSDGVTFALSKRHKYKSTWGHAAVRYQGYLWTAWTAVEQEFTARD
jgi:hypothetical protein